ncbi:MAG: hypothetical protein M1814_000439 [Vezdaea aestivalis]|nr:MAG: hypothetical protein M1814_000439 [Vezdaea aestivalis]
MGTKSDHTISRELSEYRPQIQVFLDNTARRPDYQGWETNLFASNIQIISVSKEPSPNVVFSFTVQESMTNRLGTLHGGATATLFDNLTTAVLPLVAKEGFWMRMGVSRNLNVTYLKPAIVGDIVLVECDIMGIGKKICTLRGVMRRQSDNAILATAEHHKVSIDPVPDSNL